MMSHNNRSDTHHSKWETASSWKIFVFVWVTQSTRIYIVWGSGEEQCMKTFVGKTWLYVLSIISMRWRKYSDRIQFISIRSSTMRLHHLLVGWLLLRMMSEISFLCTGIITFDNLADIFPLAGNTLLHCFPSFYRCICPRDWFSSIAEHFRILRKIAERWLIIFSQIEQNYINWIIETTCRSFTLKNTNNKATPSTAVTPK